MNTIIIIFTVLLFNYCILQYVLYVRYIKTNPNLENLVPTSVITW